ncbi:MAG: T9SS type A sorting domain-containing protein [Phaeodactylibacter sp.]|nr:T9SS type A sorting domain-containing protein [Phaeodactylibacter sp.]
MKLLSTLLFVAIAGLSFGQAVVINGPQAIAGGYDFLTAEFGASDLTADVWTADAVFIDSGGDNPSQGCTEALNPDELAGKIVLVDRGSCEFGLKALNAENGGAIAVIIINNAPGAGPMGMAAGQVGGQVTVPVVSLAYEVGQLIRSVLLSDQIVNISIGNIVPPPPPVNDIAITNANVLIPRYGIIPASQVQEPGDFVFTPGAELVNQGLVAAPNYNINVTITHTPPGGAPTEVYNETFSSPDTVSVDSTTEFTVFPEFDPIVAGTGAGFYEYSYSISMDSVDNAAFNNEVSASFTLSENMYSKAPLNPNTGNPDITASTTIAGGGPIEFITALDIPYGLDYKIDSVVFAVRYSPGLAGIPVTAYVYEWDDANDDEIVDIADGELTGIKGIALITFPEDYTSNSSDNTRLPLLDFETFEENGVVIPANDMKYLVGVRYEGELDPTLGFSSAIDYGQTLEWKQANGDTSDLDVGILLETEWDETGLPTGLTIFANSAINTSTGVIITSLISDVEEIAGADKIDINIFPNPVANRLQLEVNFKEKPEYVEYYGYDAAGRLVLHQRNTDVFDTDRSSFDVSQLPAGEYHLVVRTGLGIRTSTFVVAR